MLNVCQLCRLLVQVSTHKMVAVIVLYLPYDSSAPRYSPCPIMRILVMTMTMTKTDINIVNIIINDIEHKNHDDTTLLPPGAPYTLLLFWLSVTLKPRVE